MAVSFASEQRPYVVQVVRECERLGLAVFYDADRSLDFWGKNVIRELRDVYGSTQARYFVPFLSPEYLAKPYPMDEFTTALTQSLQRPADYILPVVFTSTEIPINLLNPATGYLRAEDHSPTELAEKIAQKITTTPAGPPPRTVAAMMEQSVHAPRVEMHANAKDNAKVYMSGGDMHITDHD